MSAEIHKVLMTVDTIGGVWTYAIQLCAAFKKYDIEVILATMGPPPDTSQKKHLFQYDNITLHESNFKLEWMDDPWEDIEKAAAWLLDLKCSTDPDIIHLNGFFHAALPWLAPVIVVAHSCVCSWFDHVKRCDPPPAWNNYKENVRKGLNAANCIITPSRAMRNDLYKQYNHTSPTTIIANGLSHFYSQKKIKEQFILTAGRLWDEAKNFDTLLKIVPGIRWPLFAAGPYKQSTLSTENVHLLGTLPTEQMADWMNRASIFASPALYEPFGLTTLEAAHYGCALVIGAIESQKEIWDDAAIFVHPCDEQELKYMLNHLISTPSLLLKMSKKAATRANQYTIENTARCYIDLYHSLLCEPSQSKCNTVHCTTGQE